MPFLKTLTGDFLWNREEFPNFVLGVSWSIDHEAQHRTSKFSKFFQKNLTQKGPVRVKKMFCPKIYIIEAEWLLIYLNLGWWRGSWGEMKKKITNFKKFLEEVHPEGLAGEGPKINGKWFISKLGQVTKNFEVLCWASWSMDHLTPSRKFAYTSPF